MLVGTSRRNAGYLARHSSLGSNVARYTSIRAFFSQQALTTSNATAPPITPFLQARTRGHLVRFDLHIRAFSFTSIRPLEKGPGSAKEELASRSRTEDTKGAPLPPDEPPIPPQSNIVHYPQFIQNLIAHTPHLHRPTRDELLSVATGFWQRFRIRFKWFTIRSFRKFNADDISAFVTLLLFSQTVWMLVGTTTFFSVVFFIINSLRLQEQVARALSDALTANTGVTVVFESAVVPKWRDSRLSFKNVYISRRPGDPGSTTKAKRDPHAAHKAAVGYDVSTHPAYHGIEDDEHEHEDTEDDTHDEDNYSRFDFTVDSIDVTLSLWKWLDGKGLVKDATIKGVRGVFDRSHIKYDPTKHWDPADFRRTAAQGDFDLEGLIIEDFLITVHQPGGFRPFPMSIFRAEMREFRKQWLFWDMLHAESIVGQFDGSLFSLHRPQAMGRTNERDLRDSQWSHISRFRIDGVNIDHIQGQTTKEGPISWITSGKIDAVLDIKFPREETEDALDAILGNIADAISDSISDSALSDLIPGQRELAKPPLLAPDIEGGKRVEGEDGESEPKVAVDIDLRIKDIKAAVPVFTNNLSYVSNALIRPIVAFMNAHHTLVPIRCRAIRLQSDFEGSWTLWETGLSDEIALKVYEALAYHVMRANMRRRFQTVSLWSLQQTLSATLKTLRKLADPVRASMRETYATLDDAISLENLGSFMTIRPAS